MGLFNTLLTLSTNVGVGVERSAIGDDDNPLTDLVDAVQARYGRVAASIVDFAFDSLSEALGSDLLADVTPTTLPPAFDVDNGRADEMTVHVPEGPFIIDIGETQNVGNGEFSRVVLGAIDKDGDDNDIEQILAEHFTGRSGANLDFERKPGIDGVDVVDIKDDEFTLLIEDGDTIDELTFTGPGTKAALEKFAPYLPSAQAEPVAQPEDTPNGWGLWDWVTAHAPDSDGGWWS